MGPLLIWFSLDFQVMQEPGNAVTEAGYASGYHVCTLMDEDENGMDRVTSKRTPSGECAARLECKPQQRSWLQGHVGEPLERDTL